MMIKQFKLNNRTGNRVTIDFSSLSEESTTILTKYLRIYFLDIEDIPGFRSNSEYLQKPVLHVDYLVQRIKRS
jgi:hypothetical protein